MGRITAALKGFGAFWYDFVFGDDWRVAAGVVVALGVTYGVSRSGVPSWWLVPLGIAVFLTASLVQTTRGSRGVNRRRSPKA